jgi:hypothetical protein
MSLASLGLKEHWELMFMSTITIGNIPVGQIFELVESIGAMLISFSQPALSAR